MTPPRSATVEAQPAAVPEPSTPTTRQEFAEALSRPPAPRPAPPFLRRVDSPIGRIEIGSDGASIVSLAIARDGALPHDGAPDTGAPVLEAAAEQLEQYFDGSRTRFELPVALTGTAFQRAVWAELERLRFGDVSTYGAIGLATGRATAGRAVGGAIGANPVPIIVGCHRVLASDSRITGYSGGNGIPTKVWLLDHEGIAHR